MWNDPNQPPDPGDPYRQPPRNPRTPDAAAGGYSNEPTERFPDPAAHIPYGASPGSPNSAFGPYDAPPPYQPQGPQYSGGRPPQWPGPDYQRQQRPPAQPRPDPEYAQPARQRAYYDDGSAAYAPARPARQPMAAPAQRRAERQPRSLPHLPIAHIFLILGVLAMGYAVSQPWGVDASGTQLFIRDFSNARLSAHNVNAGDLAVRAAYAIVAVIAVLSLALILLNTVVTIFNKVLGVVGLSGCASLVFFPVLWGGATLLFLTLLAGAGFAGLGAFSNLPAVQDHGFSLVAVQQNAIGYYLWIGGLGAVFIGMLGQLVLRRR